MSEVKFTPFQKMLFRDNEKEKWRAGFFSHMSTYKDKAVYVSTGLRYCECIPYEGNEHLLGTTDSPEPPEPEFKFGDKVEVRDSGTHWEQAIYVCMTEGKRHWHRAIIKNTSNAQNYEMCRHADW